MDSEKQMVGQEEAQPEEEVVAPEGTAATESDKEQELGDREQRPRRPRPKLEELKPGMTFRGRVKNVVEFGAFVDIGVGRDGLAHISVLKRAGVDKTTKVGDVIDVAIRSVDTERNRISLTLPSLAAEGKTSLRDLNAGSVVTGKVVRLVEFGAFVDIGAQTDGLIHISQLPWGYVNHPSEVLKVGDEVQVRILDVDASRRRISLTMKGLGDDEDSSDNNAYVAAANDRDNDGEPTPTAFEIAFQEAQRKRRQRRS